MREGSCENSGIVKLLTRYPERFFGGFIHFFGGAGVFGVGAQLVKYMLKNVLVLYVLIKKK